MKTDIYWTTGGRIMGEYYRNKGKTLVQTCEMCDEDCYAKGEVVKAKLPYGRTAFYIRADKLLDFERRTQDVQQKGRANYFIREFKKPNFGTPFEECWAIFMLCQRCQDSNPDLEFIQKHLRK